ncbi:MAG: SIMPL domain-containing protein [Oleibacter sp.]|nr:SIMPL domain-containing protein [Thalassolituus sp.]
MKPLHILFISLCLTSASAMASEAINAYVEVSGYGEIEAMPDYLTLSVELSDVQKDVEAAKDRVDLAYADLTKAAKKLGIAAKDIESFRVNNYPQWNYLPNNKREFIGHRVTRSVTLNLRDITRYGALLEALMKDERVQVSGTQLKFNDLEALQNKAQKLALLNAREKAKFMAETLDQAVDGVVFIQEQGNYSPQPRMVMMEAQSMRAKSSADAGSEMSVQEQTIERQVQVRFSITPSK